MRKPGIAIGLVVIAAVAGFLLAGAIERGYRELSLPLRHDDIIRQQAREKHLDAALIAAVIYRETHFRPRTSAAGALGLMQIQPATAKFIASKTGGTKFTTTDLATPQVNIAYGSWYLAYLLRRYNGDVIPALAAYNAGEGKVDGWGGAKLTDPAQIPYPETRAYVSDVLKTRRDYRREYAKDLGL